MGYYNDANSVKEYIEMVRGYDGRFLIEILRNHLKPEATVLEIGMGPGKDLDILNQTYRTTGSDNSQIFLNLYKNRNPAADILFLDARILQTKRKFDCIYSNKVLHHLSRDELKKSFQRQIDVLNPNGIVFHSFWKGKKEEEYHGLRFMYYTAEELMRIIGDGFEPIDVNSYTEMEEQDSLYVILKKK